MPEVFCDVHALDRKDTIVVATKKSTFPAPYSKEIVDAMLPRLAGIRGTWLDPFAGQGGSLHRFVGQGHKVIGVEIEQPNVDALPSAAGLIEQGDATNLRFRPRSISALFTSVTYGNRFSDSHNAQERCRNCGGTGKVGRKKCPKCVEGRRNHHRRGYTHDIRTLTGDPAYVLDRNNTGAFGFHTQEYHDLHYAAYLDLLRVAKPDAPFLLNVSDFIKNQEIVHGATWHLIAAQSVGWIWVDAESIRTRRFRDGANRELRVDNEWLFVFRKAA